MISVTVGTNTKKSTRIVDESATLREVLEEAQIDYTRGQTCLDGSTLNPGDLDRTFAQLGIADRCYLLNVVKQDNA